MSYGMFSETGESKIQEVINSVLDLGLTRADAWRFVYSNLVNLSNKVETQEASDSAVRENVFHELERLKLVESKHYTMWMEFDDELEKHPISAHERLREVLTAKVNQLMENGYNSEDFWDYNPNWIDIAHLMPGSASMPLDMMRRLISDIDQDIILTNDRDVFNEHINNPNVNLFTLSELSTNDSLREIMKDIAIELEEKSTLDNTK